MKIKNKIVPFKKKYRKINYYDRRDKKLKNSEILNIIEIFENIVNINICIYSNIT